MKKITTREEIILLHLDSPETLEDALCKQLVKRSPEVRQAIVDVGSPRSAYLYSVICDRYPRKDLREVACRDPQWAYCYAWYADRKPRDETRDAVLNHAEGGGDIWATWYRENEEEYKRKERWKKNQKSL